MAGQRLWSGNSRKLAVLFLAVVAPPAVTLVWLGLQLLQQDRSLLAQRELESRQAAGQTIVRSLERLQEAEKELGLDSGADDYVTKPFSLREQRARIRAQLRRAQHSADRKFQFGDCEVDFDRAELRRSGQPVEITPQELRLLDALIRNRGRVLTRRSARAARDRQLRGQDRGAHLVAILADLPEVATLGFAQRMPWPNRRPPERRCG